MISFATLILTLVTGIHPVEVMVDRTVASVEMRLDDEVVETRALFDGTPLPVRAGREITLPRYDPNIQHHLVVQVRFQGDLQAEAAVALGGRFGDTAHTEITALAVELRDGHDELPAESLDGWFRKGGRPLPVAAVENPPAGVVLVRDRFAEARLGVLGHELRGRWGLFGRKRARDGLRPDDSVYLLGPVPKPSEGAGPERWLFPLSPDLADYRRHRGVTRTLTTKRFTDRNPGIMRSAQAVATAGLHAAGLGRPRAVVLVVRPTTADVSLYTPRNARGYLETLQVPLFVWFTDSDRASPLAKSWGGGRDVSDARDLLAAVEDLRATLDRQRIVWIRGRHLPQQIELSAAARKYVDFAGR